MALPGLQGHAPLTDFLQSGQHANPISSVVDCGLNLALYMWVSERSCQHLLWYLDKCYRDQWKGVQKEIYYVGDIHYVAPAPIIEGSCHSSGSFLASLRRQVDPSGLKPQGSGMASLQKPTPHIPDWNVDLPNFWLQRVVFCGPASHHETYVDQIKGE